MIKTRQKVRVTTDREDGNGLRHGYLKKRLDVSFSTIQAWVENRGNLGKLFLQCECGLSSRNCF